MSEELSITFDVFKGSPNNTTDILFSCRTVKFTNDFNKNLFDTMAGMDKFHLTKRIPLSSLKQYTQVPMCSIEPIATHKDEMLEDVSMTYQRWISKLHFSQRAALAPLPEQNCMLAFIPFVINDNKLFSTVKKNEYGMKCLLLEHVKMNSLKDQSVHGKIKRVRANILSLDRKQRHDKMYKGLRLRKRRREEKENNGHQDEFITKRARQDHGMGKNLKGILSILCKFSKIKITDIDKEIKKVSSNQSPEELQELEKRLIEALQELKLTNSTPVSYQPQDILLNCY